MLYFMLTGQRPFQGSSIATVCFKLANHEPLAVANYDMSFPPALDVVVSRAIAKSPEQRYQSGGEMARDIQRLRESCGLVPTADLEQNATPRVPGKPGRNTSTGLGLKSGGQPMSGAGARLTIPVTRARVFALALVAAVVIFVVSSRTYKVEPPPPSPPPKGPMLIQPFDSPALYRPASAELNLEIEHPFTEARASLWLDNRLAYTQVLHADPKNHLLVFRKTQGHESHQVELRSGKHLVRVRVQAHGAAYDQSRTVAVDFAPKAARTLLVNCDKKHNLLQVTLQ